MRNLKRLLSMVLLAVSISVPVAGAKDVEDLLHTMTIEAKIGQMLFPAFRTQAAQPVTSLPPEVALAVSRNCVGGVILFRENLVTPEQTTKLINDLQAASPGIPLFIGIDQEGGRVTRLPYGTAMPGNMAVAASGKGENAYLAAKATGEELRALGFNLNFAPVLDVNSNPENPVIGVRSFGEDPEMVAALGSATIRGLHDAGIAAAVKHFPGHGDTSVDSHLGLPTLPHSLKQLEARELKPFVFVLDTTAPDMIMTAHIALPNIEQGTVVSAKGGSRFPLPATLSPAILTGLLRQKLHYDGVIITDALNMKAITEHVDSGEVAVLAVQAGADMLLMPDLEKSRSALLAALQSGSICIERIDQSVRRILALKGRRGLFTAVKTEEPPAAKQERSALAASLAGQAVTLLKNDVKVLPFAVRLHDRVLLLAPQADQLRVMRQQTEEIFREAATPVSVMSLEYQGKIADSHQAAIENADQIILAVDSVDATAVSLAALAVKAAKPIAVMALRNPCDVRDFGAVPAYLAVYAPIQPNIAAGVRAIYGIQPQGKLPVSILRKDGSVLFPLGFGLEYKP